MGAGARGWVRCHGDRGGGGAGGERGRGAQGAAEGCAVRHVAGPAGVQRVAGQGVGAHHAAGDAQPHAGAYRGAYAPQRQVDPRVRNRLLIPGLFLPPSTAGVVVLSLVVGEIHLIVS